MLHRDEKTGGEEEAKRDPAEGRSELCLSYEREKEEGGRGAAKRPQ